MVSSSRRQRCCRRRTLGALGALLALGATTAAQAARVLNVQAIRDGDRFQISLRISLDAPAPAIFRALRDYAAMPRYDADLRAVRVEPTANADQARLFMTIHTCVLLFCKTIQQQELMASAADARGGVLQATLIPADGAFDGQGRWAVAPCSAPAAGAAATAAATAAAAGAAPVPACVDVQLELVPHFWVPPMIGPWLVRRKMVDEARQISAGLERAAQRAAADSH